jgi:membrane associated rhomboid family serine protease
VPAQPRKHSLQFAIGEAGALVGLMVAIKLIEVLLGISFARFGIVPRDPHGAIGILGAPLLHGNLAHLFANIGPLFILLVLLYWDRTYHPTRTVTLIWLASGLGTWLIGRAVALDGTQIVHIGASSLIYGLVAYMIVAGVLARQWRSFFVAIIVFAAFGGIVYGVLPQQDATMSWEGHLSGAIAGVMVASNNFSRRSSRKSVTTK